MLERDFQGKQVIPWLKRQGCFVMKVQAGPGVPKGTADVFFAKEGFFGWLECKASKNAKKQVGQEAFIKKMNDWSYARFVWGGKNSNWPEVKAELQEMLK